MMSNRSLHDLKWLSGAFLLLATLIIPPHVRAACANVEDWRLSRMIGEGLHYQMAYSPDGTRLATAGSIGIVIWDLKDKAIERVLIDETGWTNALAWSPDGARIASGSAHAIHIWAA